jgi:DNA invertase Pin-like site-specific DNA recombinase
VRVSTEAQAEAGVSLDEQRTRIRAYAAAHGAEVVALAADRVSGRTVRRPALQRALARLRAGEADALVAVRLDRVSRTTRDVLDLVARAEREGWALHSIEERLDTGSPQGRFVVTVLGALAQLEREQAAGRTRAALAELRRQGRRVSGKPPLGYRFRAGRLVEVPEEQRIVRRLKRLRAKGLGAKAIAVRLNAAGILNPRTGRPWHHGTVRDVLATAARHGG